MRCFGPTAHPSFHPVTEKVLPADPMVTVLSHIPGRVAIRIISARSRSVSAVMGSPAISAAAGVARRARAKADQQL